MLKCKKVLTLLLSVILLIRLGSKIQENFAKQHVYESL